MSMVRIIIIELTAAYRMDDATITVVVSTVVVATEFIYSKNL